MAEHIVTSYSGYVEVLSPRTSQLYRHGTTAIVSPTCRNTPRGLNISQKIGHSHKLFFCFKLD
ncbi:hypothetical protein J6590_068259 [Homalodisca vitripennis]|nr:hypothetical protein J6590_068259 [Homalodisca vitripennis]